MTTLQELRNKHNVKIFDNSMLSTFKSCPRKFYYRHMLGLVLNDDPQPKYALQYGLAIHQALEVWYRDGKDDQQALGMFVKEFSPHEEPPGVSKAGREVAPTYTILAGCLTLEVYFRQNRTDNRTVVATELPLAEQIKPKQIFSGQCATGNEYFIAGRIDKVLQPQENKLVFVDYKTTKYPDQFQTNPNGQFQTYKHLLQTWMSSHVHVSGELDIIGVGKTKSPSQLLRHEPLDYTDYQMHEWQKSTVETMSLVEAAIARDEYPMWTNSCRVFFRDCAFMPMCTAANKDIRRVLQEKFYRVEFWDPLQTITTD